MARRVTGDRELTRLLTKLAAHTEPICVESLQAWADDVQAAAKRRAPVLTGALRDAIDTNVTTRTLTAYVGVLESPDGSQEPQAYAPVVEHGNSRQSAQPFLHPAFERHRDVRPYVRDAIERRI